jgi:hypothetical protein
MWKTSARFRVDVENGEIAVTPDGGPKPEFN